ncbi:hypothetical protein [Microcoleus sp. herbarium14]|uniref:hypothetical protein n=1 Tax=Microcoleus sp. herbarium14 TaxID=3055439 RepID=UPI002FD22739
MYTGYVGEFQYSFCGKISSKRTFAPTAYFVKSFLKVVRSQFLIYGEFGLNADRLLGKKVMETTNQKTIINLTGIRYISG